MQQLIVRNNPSNGNLEYNTFLANNGVYRNMVTFIPSDIQPGYTFVATSQGSQCGDPVLQPYAELVKTSADAGYTVGFGGFGHKLSGSMVINALPNGTAPQRIAYFKLKLTSKIFWININSTLVDFSHNSPAGILGFDGAPGGTIPISRGTGIGNIPPSWGDGPGFLPAFIFEYVYNFDGLQVVPEFSFVSTASALDQENISAASLYAPNTGYSYISPADPTLLQSYKTQENVIAGGGKISNIEHTEFTARNAQWIFNKMENYSQTYDCEDYCENNMSITGSNQICSTAIYKVNGLFPGATVTWSATPSNMVVFDCATCAQTTVTRNDNANGQTTLTANISGPCGNTYLTIPITVGVPNNPLSIYGIPDNYNGCKNSIFNVTGSGGLGNSVWTVEGGQIISGQGTSEIYIQLDNTPGTGFYIGLSESNACGLSSVLATKQGNILDCDGGGGTTTRISPNPTNGQLTVAVTDIKTTRNSIKALIVRNKMGRIFTKMEFPKGVTQHTFNISNLPNDLYLIEIFDGKVWLKHKVILRN